MSKPQQEKKGPSKQPEKKIDRINQFVESITDDNSIRLFSQGKEPSLVKLANFLFVPRYDRKSNKYETFAYECKEYLRKRLVTGKKVRFDVVDEVKTTKAVIKYVVPYVQKENIVVSLLEKGYVVLNEKKLNKSDPSNKIYLDAAKSAADHKVGVHSDNPLELASKVPSKVKFNEAEIKDFIKNQKTLTGHIYNVKAPASYTVITEDRKLITVALYGVDQLLEFREGKPVLDEDGKNAMQFIRKYFNQRDCTIKFVAVTPKGLPLVHIEIEKKDVAEELLKNGFVVCIRNIEESEEVKQKYQAAEKIAKKSKAARWTDFDQAEEDRIIAERQKRQKEIQDRIKNAPVIKGEIVSFGRCIIVKCGDKEYRVNLASIYPLYKNNEKFDDILDFRIKETLRKELVEKSNVSFKEAYKVTYENKKGEKKENVYYDAYVGQRNVALTLINQGLVGVEKEKEIFKRSFDYDELFKARKENAKEFDGKEPKFYGVSDDKKKFENSVADCIVEKVFTPVRYLIYLPKEDCRMGVNLDHCRLPKDVAEKEKYDEFLKEACKEIRKLFSLKAVPIEFTKSSKRGESYNINCDITIKKTSLIDYVLKHGYALPYDYKDEEIDEMRETNEKIYQFLAKREEQSAKPQRKEKVKKEVVKELKFSEEKNVYIIGCDGQNIYYYDNAADAEYLKELCTQLRALPKGPVEMKEKNMCVVEIKQLQYRATILEVRPSANIVQCVDTGVLCICGKGKLKPITEEFAKKEFKKPQQIALCGVKTLKRDDKYFKAMMEEFATFYGKEAKIYVNTVGEKENTRVSAKVIVGEECLNVHIIREGLSTVDKYFNDQSAWGKEMFEAEKHAHEQHLNIYQYGELYDDDEKKN